MALQKVLARRLANLSVFMLAVVLVVWFVAQGLNPQKLHHLTREIDKKFDFVSLPSPWHQSGENSILVTGAAGFIGFHLCGALAAVPGVRLTALDSFDDATGHALKRARAAHLLNGHNVTVIPGDVCDADVLARLLDGQAVAQVVHLAASAGVRRSLSNPPEYVRNNIDCFTVLLEALRVRPHVRLVYASSSSVYGRGESRQQLSEDSPLPPPINTYAASKRAGELLAAAYASAHGVESLGLRLFTVYGPWSRPDMSGVIFANAARAGARVGVTSNTLRDFTFVSDVVDGIVRSLHTRVSVPVLNLGGGTPVTVDAFLSLIEAGVGRHAVREAVPGSQYEAAATWADSSLAKRLLGWAPRTSLAAGVARFAEWFLHTDGGADGSALAAVAAASANERGAGFAFVALAAAYRPLIIGVLTPGTLLQARNWLCNTAGMPSVHARTVLFAYDAETAARVRSWGTLASVFELRSPHAASTARAEAVLWGDPDFSWIVLARQLAVLQVLRAGADALVIDLDWTWFGDVLGDAQRRAAATGADVVGVANKAPDDSIRAVTLCGCLIHLRAGASTVLLFEDIVGRMRAAISRAATKKPAGKNSLKPEFHAEQPVINASITALVREGKLSVTFLDAAQYPSGQYYSRRFYETVVLRARRPLAVHNNAIVGSKFPSKPARARAFGVWFVHDGNGTCDTGAVEAALRRGLPDPAGFLSPEYVASVRS